MRHAKAVSRQLPATAQFEPLLQLVGLISALLGVYEQFTNLFGIPVPQKND